MLAGTTSSASRLDLTLGKLEETGAALNLALATSGYMAFEGADGVVYSRNGQLEMDSEGRLTGIGGRTLVAEGGGDIRPGTRDFEIAADGAVLVEGETIARIALFDPGEAVAAAGPDGGLRFTGDDMTSATDRLFRQGWLETSNVVLGQEMMALMEAVRRAESGQRLINTYDDLMGRVITTFSQSPA
ncbi:flagellar basal body rod C-terminal domain-containing protein [Brevundimonas faecalis]|uniref:Flagellar basal-body rod protein FlgF n=1 Tax=Brevundimonas faecalis TaxID=947378 RepID=A0ABV2R7L2_9CAUL